MTPPRPRSALAALALLPLLALCGCEEAGPAADWTNIDLDRVLAAAVETLEQPLPGEVSDEAEASLSAAAAKASDAPDVPADAARTAIAEVPMHRRSHAVDDAFVRAFEENLNGGDPPLWATPLSVRFAPDGALVGSAAGAAPGAADVDLFNVQVDAGNGRLVATDLADPEVHREKGYRFRPGGFFMGYMLGSMLGGQRGAYGRTPGAGPGFARMKMAPDGYAKRGSGFGTSRSRAAAPSSRSLGGSRSFMGGK